MTAFYWVFTWQKEPGSSLVVRILGFHWHGLGFSPWLGNWDSASLSVQPKRKKRENDIALFLFPSWRKCRTDAGVALLLTTPGHLPLTVFSAFNLKERSSNPKIPGAWDRSGNYFFKFCGDPGEMGPYHNPSEVMPRKESVRHIWELSNMIFELHSCLCEACTITIPILWLSKPSLGALK